MRRRDFCKKLVRVASLVSLGCSGESNTSKYGIPKLPTENPRDYVFDGIIGDTYFKFKRDMSYGDGKISEGVKVLDKGIKYLTGSERVIGRIGKKNINVLIERGRDETETIFYDFKGAGEKNDRGDLRVDYAETSNGNVLPGDNNLQRRFVSNLITIYNHKQSKKSEKSAERSGGGPKERIIGGRKKNNKSSKNDPGAKKGLMDKLRKFR